jgi:hypothetical protein
MMGNRIFAANHYGEGLTMQELAPVRDARATVLDSSTTYAFGKVENIFISVWRGANTAFSLGQQSRLLQEFVARHRKNAAFVCVIEPSSPKPSPEYRDQMVDTLKAAGKDLNCVAVVAEGDGLRSASVRAILTAVSLLRSQAQPTNFFAEAKAAQKWMSGLLKLPLELNLAKEVEAIRAHVKGS